MRTTLSERKIRLYLCLASYIAFMFPDCKRGKVACILVSETGVTFGYNGGAAGDPVSCIGGEPGTCGCVHAEANAVAKSSLTGHIVAFCTTAPCKVCASLLVNHGVKEVYYTNEYRDTQGVNTLKRCGVKVRRIEL